MESLKDKLMKLLSLLMLVMVSIMFMSQLEEINISYMLMMIYLLPGLIKITLIHLDLLVFIILKIGLLVGITSMLLQLLIQVPSHVLKLFQLQLVLKDYTISPQKCSIMKVKIGITITLITKDGIIMETITSLVSEIYLGLTMMLSVP